MSRQRVVLLASIAALSACGDAPQKWAGDSPVGWLRGASGLWVGSLEVTAESDANSQVGFLLEADLYSPEHSTSSRVTLSLPLRSHEPAGSLDGIRFEYEGSPADFPYDNAGTVVSFGPPGTAPEQVEALEGGWTSVDHVNRPEETTGSVSSFTVTLARDGSLTGEIRWVWSADQPASPPPVQTVEVGGAARRSCVFAGEGFTSEWASLSSPECARLFRE